MTTITAQRNGSFFTLQAHGHATGSAECCAAVSMTMQTLACYLESSKIKIYKMHIEPGNVCLSYSLRRKEARNVTRLALMGIAMLASDYPEYVSSNVELYLGEF